MAEQRKRTATTADLVRSLVVILVPLLIIVFVFTRTTDGPEVTPVEVAPVLAQARQQAPYEVLAPAALPADWTPTRVSWEPDGRSGEPPQALWVVGYLSPDKIYYALHQSPDAAVLVPDQTRDGLPDGVSTLAGVEWERRVSPDDRTRSLVRSAVDVTTVISADTDYAALEAFAGTLRTR